VGLKTLDANVILHCCYFLKRNLQKISEIVMTFYISADTSCILNNFGVTERLQFCYPWRGASISTL